MVCNYQSLNMPKMFYISQMLTQLKSIQTHLNPVISLQRGRLTDEDLGGTLRLGLYDCEIKKGTKAYKAYESTLIKERHRHRYEFNNQYLEQFEESKMIISGFNSEYQLVEMIELEDHPWFVAVQFHPEFISRPLRPHPLFRDFIEATVKYKKSIAM